MIEWERYPQLKRMWTTRGARFVCHHRLSRKNVWFSYTISLLSAYVIMMSIYEPLGLEILSSVGNKIVLLISILTSVIIIFVSLIEGGKNYAARAEAMHSCARDISVIYHKSEAKLLANPDAELHSEVMEYDGIVARCAYNHDPLDREIFLSQNASENGIGRPTVIWTLLKEMADVYGVFFISAIAVPVAWMLLLRLYGLHRVCGA